MKTTFEKRQKTINSIAKFAGFGRPLSPKQFAEIDKGDYAIVDEYLKKQKEQEGIKNA